MNHARRALLGGLIAGACSNSSWTTAWWSRSGLASEPGENKGPDRKDSRKDVAWLAEAQIPPTEFDGAPVSLSSLTADDQGAPLDSLEVWRRRRAEIRAAWSDYLGELRLDRPRPRLETISEDTVAGCVRRLTRYESEPGIAVEGYLLLPARTRGPAPGVVAMHSTCSQTIRQPAGLEGDEEDFFGLKLAQRGFVVYCPRCFLWEGRDNDFLERVREFKSRRPDSRGMAKMLWDATRALDVLEAQPEVDPHRLGAVGHSLGAKEALYLAAFDERVQAAVASEGGVGRSFTNWDAPWYLGESIEKDSFAHDHHELLALIAPRPFLILGGDKVGGTDAAAADGPQTWPYVESALRIYRLYGEPARLGLFRHGRGHSVPPEAETRLYDWLQRYLG